MRVLEGWKPVSVKCLAWFIKMLTRRIVFVCELTTAVYGPAATVSRVFCRYYIRTKPLQVNDFGVIPWMEYA